MSLLVNLYAGPSTGKSTTAAGVFSLLKMHDINSELITEFAKDLCWEGRKVALKNQYYIFGKQYHKIYRVIDQVDVAITDSPILFNLIYGKLYGINYPDSFYDTIRKTHYEFNNLNFFLERVKLFNPAGREQNEAESIKLDSEILNMLNGLDIEYESVIGDYLGINKITEKILEKLDRSIEYKIMKGWIGKVDV